MTEQEPGTPAIPNDPREPLGRVVHGERIAYSAAMKPPRGYTTWEDRDPGQRELDMRMGHAAAVYALTENAATYGVSCASCAGHLDRASMERERAERAEVKLAVFAAERDRVVREMLRRADRAVPGIERAAWLAAAEVARGEPG